MGSAVKEWARRAKGLSFLTMASHTPAPKRYVQALNKCDNCIDFINISAAEGCVDLNRQADLVSPTNRVDCPRKRPAHSTERVVGLGASSFHTYCKPGKSSLLEPGQQSSVSATV
jgi:hypothetical protein